MKIQTNKKSKKALIVSLSIILVLAISAFAVYGYIEKQKNDQGNDSSQTAVEGDSTSKEDSEKIANKNAEQKQELLDKEATSTNQNTPQPVTNDSISLSAEDDDDTVTVLTKLSTLPSGTCTLTVKNGNKTVTQTAEVLFQPQYSSCAGFSVSKSNLGKGVWSINLSIVSGNTSLNKAIDYRVL